MLPQDSKEAENQLNLLIELKYPAAKEKCPFIAKSLLAFKAKPQPTKEGEVYISSFFFTGV